jgi:pimeloyl-ACP methyl ester carboxylesterase
LPRYIPNKDEIKYLATWNSFEHDPSKYYTRLHIPVYAVFGEKDWFIPVDQSIKILNSLYAGKQHLLTLKQYPNADHFIKEIPPGNEFEFPKFADRYISDLTHWIIEKAKHPLH